MSNEGMRKSMIAGGVLMKGVLRMSLILYPLICVETPALALNCELDRTTAACLLDIVPPPRSHRPFTFQLQLKSKEFFGIRTENGREYLEQGGSSSPAIWDPVFSIVDWELWARTPTGFLPVASGVGSSGTPTPPYSGGFILHVRTKLNGVVKKHIRLPDGGAEEIEVASEEMAGTEHHDILVHSWAEGDTVDVDTPVFDSEGRYWAMPLDTTLPPDSNLIKIHVHGSTPPISAFAVFYVELEGGGHEAANHDPHRPLGTFAPPGIPAGHPSGRIFTVVPYRPNLRMNYHASEFGGIGRIRVVAIDTPFSAPTPPAALAVQYARRQTLIADIDERIAEGRGFEVSSFEIKVQMTNLHLLPNPGTGDEYEKIGGTPRHHGPPSSTAEDNNHWGAEDVINALPIIARRARQAPPSGLGVSNRLKYNDISLGDEGEGYGGAFDIRGRWGLDIVPGGGGHQLHRTGRDVDMRSTSTAVPRADGFPVSLLIKFRDEIVIPNGGVDVEVHSPGSTTNEHIHIYF